MTDEARNGSQPKNYRLIAEKDVKIALRDGATPRRGNFGRDALGDGFNLVLGLAMGLPAKSPGL